MRTLNRLAVAGILFINLLLLNSNLKAQTPLPSIDELETKLRGAMNSLAGKHCCINYCSSSEGPIICIDPVRPGAVCGECINGDGEVGVYTQDLNSQSNDTTFDSPIIRSQDIPELDSMIVYNTLCMKLINIKSDSINKIEMKIQDQILLLLQKPGKVKKLRSLMKLKNNLAGDLFKLNKIQSKINVFAMNHYMHRVSGTAKK